MSPPAPDTLETLASENQCACEVNMLPVMPLPQPIRFRNLWEVPKCFCSALVLLATLVPCCLAQSVSPPPQGTQRDAAFADSFRLNHVSNVFATTQKTSCYT